MAGAATLLCGVFGLGAIAFSSSPSAAAATANLFVDNVHGQATTGCTSSGAGACKTIQEGVSAAEALTSTAVTLDVAGSATSYDEMVTINLTASSADSLVIEGTGSTQPTLDDGGTGSNVTIDPTSAGAVTIGSLTISGGNALAADHGGGIADHGTGTLSIASTTFSNNTALNNGGAIDIADGCGGGISGDLVVTDSTFVGNSVSDTDGGAIDAQDCGGTGTIAVSDSTFESNVGGAEGGAIAAWNGGTVTNSTFASNSAPGGGGALGGDSLSLVDDTFTANANTAIFNGSGFSIANSILNDASAGPECQAPITDGGHNVSSDATCHLGPTSISSSSTIGTLSLAVNGSSGPQTAAITKSSSAYGIVPLSACTLATDERGQPRPGPGRSSCDAGAYEFQLATGYDLAGSDGGVFVFPLGQPFGYFGSLPGLGIKVNNVVGLVPTNNFHGYDLAGSDGGVFVFPLGQPAGYYGSLPGLGVKVSDIVGLVPTNNDTGYNLVGRDGGVFVFPTGQSAGYYGSLPGLGVKVSDIVGIVDQPGGGGYLLAGRDGGVFAFGSAHYYGSLPGMGVSANNIVAIAPTLTGKGYYLVASNGAVYPFGDAVSHGSLPAMGVSVSNVVGIVPTADGAGYWLIGSDGGVFAFGDAGFIGSLPGLGLKVTNIVGAVPTLF
jgi:predicted outer membrane repeat protein